MGPIKEIDRVRKFYFMGKREQNVTSLVTTYKMWNTVADYLYESIGVKYLSTGEEEQEVKLILTLK